MGLGQMEIRRHESWVLVCQGCGLEYICHGHVLFRVVLFVMQIIYLSFHSRYIAIRAKWYDGVQSLDKCDWALSCRSARSL